MKRRNFYLAVFFMLIFSAILISGCNNSNSNSAAYDEPLEKIDGGTLTLNDLKGKVVVIDFWATWCKPCRDAIPHLKKIHEKYEEDEDVIVLGINMDYDKSISDIENFINKEGIEYTVVKCSEKFARSFGIRGIPTFLILDKEGKIDTRLVGFNPSFFSQMPSTIDKLKKE